MQQPDIVMNLRAELLRANAEIMALKNGNLSLKEQVEKLERQLTDKDGLIKKEIKKRRARLRAYIDCMAELTECQAKTKSMEAILHQEPPQPETSWSRRVEVEEEKEKEIQALKEQVEQLEQQLTDKDGLIEKESKKRRAGLRAYIDCMAELTECQAKAKNMEALLHQEPPQPETSWSREVEKEKEKEKEKEIQTLKEQVEQLEHQSTDKDGLIKKEIKKRRARLRAYIDCMAELTECQAKAKNMEALLHQEPPQPDTSWSRMVEVEKEKEIQALKEQVEQLGNQLTDKCSAYIDCKAELTECQAKAKNMEASLHQEPPQPETSFSRMVEVEEEKEKEKEIQALKEQVEQLGNQLTDKCSAYIDCKAELTECQAKAKNMEASLHQEPPQPETSCSREVEKEKEIQAVKEQVEQLQHQLNDKEGLIKKETTKKRDCFTIYIDCMEELTESQAKSKSMELSLHKEPPQPETSWSREVEVDKENQAPKWLVNPLEVRQKRPMVKPIKKNQLLMGLSCRKVEA